MILNKQLIDLMLKAEQKAMPPHDELMALAGKWEAEGAGAYLTGNPVIDARTQERDSANHRHAADLRALLDSDAFRAMVRDAWLPIESAPEGEAVHVYTPDLGDGERFGIDVLVDGAWQEHAESYDHYIAVGGAGACGPDVICTGPGPDAPYTHWRPLTPPQAIDAAASGAGEG